MLHKKVMHKKIVLIASLVIATLGLVVYTAFFRTERTLAPVATPADLPGSEEFGLTKADLVKHIEVVEQGIASCMKAAGFQYVPVDYLTVRKSMDADKRTAGVTDEEFRKQFGYGITTRTTTPGVAPQLSSADHAATLGLGRENMRIFESLSPTNQIAYNRALLGEDTTATFAVSLEAEDFSKTGGCTRAAVEQAFQEEELGAAYLNPGDALIAQDQRVIAATAKWADCLRDAGFTYNNPEEIEPDLKTRLAAASGDALIELQGEERALAVADFTCAEEFIEPAVHQVETELYGAPQN